MNNQVSGYTVENEYDDHLAKEVTELEKDTIRLCRNFITILNQAVEGKMWKGKKISRNQIYAAIAGAKYAPPISGGGVENISVSFNIERPAKEKKLIEELINVKVAGEEK